MLRPAASFLCALHLACALAVEPPKITSDAQHDAAYKRAVALISPHMRLFEQTPEITQSASEELTDGVAYMRAVTEYNPRNWAAFWIEGKAYQALGQNAAANAAFQAAYNLQRGNADVAREYAESCLALGRANEAIDATRQAIGLAPDDAGLRANLALAFLIAGRNQDALQTITSSLQMNPTDGISRRLKAVIEDVIAGRRVQPRTLADVR